MNLAACFPGRARRSALMGGSLRAFALGTFVLISLTLFNAFAVAQSVSSPLVYATQKAFITQYYYPQYQGLAIYQWPRLDRVALHPELPEHDYVLVSPNGREIYLFSSTTLTVVDRVSMQPLRTLARPVGVPDNWGREAKISPLRPDLLLAYGGYWLSLGTGQVVKTPANLAPGYNIGQMTLDDRGERVVLRLYRQTDNGGTELRTRVVDLDGRPITTRDFEDLYNAVLLSDNRIAVFGNHDTNVRVLDLNTQALLKSLRLPATYYVIEMASDGRGGLWAVVSRPIPYFGRASLLHWPQLREDPVTLQEFPNFGGYKLRVSGNKLMLLTASGEYCLTGVCSLPRGFVYMYDVSNGEASRVEDTQHAFGIYDAAPFSPVGVAQPSTVPTMGTWASVILGSLLMLFACRTLARLRATVGEPARAWHRT